MIIVPSRENTVFGPLLFSFESSFGTLFQTLLHTVGTYCWPHSGCRSSTASGVEPGQGGVQVPGPAGGLSGQVPGPGPVRLHVPPSVRPGRDQDHPGRWEFPSERCPAGKRGESVPTCSMNLSCKGGRKLCTTYLPIWIKLCRKILIRIIKVGTYLPA